MSKGSFIRITGDDGQDMLENQNEDFGLDEIVAELASVHIERIDKDRFWMRIEAGGKSIAVSFYSDKEIKAEVRDD